MSSERIARARVIIGKTSLGELADLNKIAWPDFEVLIGCTQEAPHRPHYIVLRRQPLGYASEGARCFNKESVLEALVSGYAKLGRGRGDTDGD